MNNILLSQAIRKGCQYRKQNRGVFFYKMGESKLNSEWLAKFVEYQKKPTEQNIILAWTNNQTNDYNREIRKQIFSQNKPNMYEVGDLLMLDDFYDIDEMSVKSRFYTSEQIKVISVEECYNIPIEFKYVNILGFPEVLKAHWTKCVNDLNKKTKRSYKIYKLNISRVPSNGITYVINVIHKNASEMLDGDKIEAELYIKNFRKTILHQYKEHSEEINDCMIKQLWEQWNKIFVDQYANVTYGYAHSVHKSQGSSFYNVFVDAQDILNNPNVDEAKRCLYTAFTRTSNELHILI